MKTTSCITCLSIILAFAGCVAELGHEEPASEQLDGEDDPVLAAELHIIVDGDPEHGRCRTHESEGDDADIIDADASIPADEIVIAASLPEVTIGVRWHVIRSVIDGKMRGNLSASRIDRQIDVLNEAFAGSRFRFELLKVTRTTNHEWYRMGIGSTAEHAAKQALHGGGPGVLNIYSTGTFDALGWSTFPWHAAGGHYDGIVVKHATVPNESGGRFSLGDTAVHEAGHWLGLFHTFGNYADGCTYGDGVGDTSKEKTPAYGCPVGRNTCAVGGNDPIHNFMDYTDDSCMFRFSNGQRTRMSNKWERWRAD